MFVAIYCKYKELQKIEAQAKAMRDTKKQVGVRIIEYYKGDSELCDKVLYTEGCEAVIEPFTARGIPVEPLFTTQDVVDTTVTINNIPMVRRGRPRRGDI